MAPRRPTPQPQSANLSVEDMKRGVVRLKRRITDLEAFDPSVIEKRWGPEVEVLGKSIEETLAAVFGHGTIEYSRYSDAADLDNGPVRMQTDFGGFGRQDDRLEAQQYAADGKLRSISLLRGAIRGLEEAIIDNGDRTPAVNSEIVVIAAKPQRKIFVVHGHDEGARETVARFLEGIDFEVVILHEQANQGRTVIEKVEAHGEVSFAVVLLTPDDLGKGKDAADLSPRARQNVLLELGYFIGRLGRSHVCALKRGVLEIPSDFVGVVYEAFDEAGGWKQALGRELQAAGFEVDWNKVMRR